jgi:multiple sugar transport system ATP-binding protein
MSVGSWTDLAEITLEGVTKVFPDGTRAVSSLDLAIADGEFMVLVGPSGCGKTTALRLVAGLEEVTDGTLRIGGRVVNTLTPKQRDIAMVFQDYALYPHMTVFENMAFGLKLSKVPKPEVKRRVHAAARNLGIHALLNKRPRALSGGQRQRVAMGRAIVREPQAFLMDEPLSNLDAKLRVQMRAEIARIQRDLGVTTIYVTHDQTEAMTMGDRVAVMNRGVLQQVARPQELYRRPANVFVGGFIGSPAMNVVQAELVRGDDGIDVVFAGHRLRVAETTLADRPALDAYVGRAVILGIRPEHLEDASLARSAPPERRMAVTVDLREELGSEVLALFPVDAPIVLVDEASDLVSDDATNEEQPRRLNFLARLDARTTARERERLELTVETDNLLFFDPDSGDAIGAARTEAAPAYVPSIGQDAAIGGG